jgi:hypothetical protein
LKRRHALLSLSIVVAAVFAVQGVQAAPKADLLPMTGETLNAPTVTVTSRECRGGALDYTMSYSVSGTAVGPYPGTFTETGTYSKEPIPGGFESETFEATFTITSGETVITGTKSGGSALGNVCFESTVPGVPNCCAGFHLVGAQYEARIESPEGTFVDQGTTGVTAQSGFPFVETFVSTCDEVKDKPGTDKDKCKTKMK